MESLLRFWPLLAFITGLFFSGLGVAVGLTMWILGKLMEQDARRIELKESILVEIRERHHTLQSGMDQRNAIVLERLDAVGNRVTRVETILNGKRNATPY